METFVKFIPEYLNLVVMALSVYALYKLELVYMQERKHRQPSKERKRSGDTIVVVEPGLLKMMIRDRFAQCGVLLIAVPDIPVLIKLFS